MSQKRQTASKQKIFDAYLKLLTEKELDAISVTDICREAQVNRGTFYLHYQDKYSLIEQVHREHVGYFLNTLEDDAMTQLDKIVQALCFLLAKRDFFRKIIQIEPLHFEDNAISMLQQIFENSNSFSKHFHPYLNLPEPYGLTTLTAAIIKIIIVWIERDFQESPEEIAHMLLSLTKQT